MSGGAGENLERPRITGSKGRSSHITANKDVRGCLKREGDGERRWWRGRNVMLCGRGWVGEEKKHEVDLLKVERGE